MIKNAIVAGLCLATGIAMADCHVRSDIRLNRQSIFAGPTDLQQIVTPDAAGKKCVIRYRVNIDGEWQTAEGEGRGTTEAEACTQAANLNRASLLEDIDPSKVSADTQMVCSDLEDIRVRTVKIGETVWESETNVHPIPAERAYFKYKFSTCRMFSERNARGKNFYTYQGVICRIMDTPGSRWIVVDKY